MMAARIAALQQPSLSSKAGYKMVDTLSRHLEELCRPGALERRKDGERPLLEFVEAEARDLSPEAFGRFMNDIYNRIQGLLAKTNDNLKRLGGVLAINELVEVKTVGDDAAKTSRLAAMLARALEDADDPVVMDVAAKTLGHLVKSGGAMTSDIVEREVRRAICWCDPKAEPSEFRRLAAVLLLKEMAEQAPAVFNVHVKSFIDFIWHPLRDPKLHIREASVQALKGCLCLVEKRETRYRVQWYYKLFEQTMRGLNRDRRSQAMPNGESIHGSLLALGELLQHTGEFLLARYREVSETVLRFKDSKEKQIRRAVITLLPRMAAFSPERFASEYLPRALVHLLGVLKHQPERGAAFAAIADMAVALAAVGCAAGFEQCLPAIAAQVREAILAKTKSKVQCPEALQCVGTLSKALGSLWKPHAQALLENMMLTGLSDILVSSLTQTSEALPELLEEIQFKMLDLLSLALAKRPFNIYTTQPRFQALSAALASGDLQGGQLIKLALQTVGTFEWTSKVSLLEFMRDHILMYTDDTDKDTRQAAVLACCKVLERHASSVAMLKREGMPGAAANVRSTRVVEKVVSRLLVCSVADPSERVRKAVLQALHATTALDDYLAQAECLRSLFVALNDLSCTVRSLAIKLVGRLADKNPAYVNPALRRHLIQLLADMEHSPDSKHREESAYLMDCLIVSAPKLIMPYVSPIQRALVLKLRGGMAAQAVSLGQPQVVNTSMASPAMMSSVGSHGVGSVGSVLGGGGGSGAGGSGGSPMVQKQNTDGKPSKETSTENGLVKTVLATIGQLAQVSHTSFRPYVADVMPLVIEAVQDVSSMRKRLVAVKTLGQIVKNTGTVMTPYSEFPQLLSILLHMLHEGSGPQRKEVMKVLGIVGALDPHTHKTNQASLSGEGKLEKEGVRALRHNQVKEIINHGEGAANLPTGSLGTGAAADDFAADLLPASGMVTSSDEYYPTVAINALMRVLRDPSYASQHMNVIASLMSIFKALSLSSVPYLPKVLPVLFRVMRSSDEVLREEMLQQLTRLVSYVRQHIRRFLPDIMQLVHEYWAFATRTCLALLAELSSALRDDFRLYIPELLPKFVMLFGDAERTNVYDLVRPALTALEALGTSIEEHLHLLLPSLVRLINSGGQASTPLETSRLALKSMRKLLPRMQLSGYASNVLHSLLKVLDGPHDELRRDALDAICALAVVLGQDFAIFVPTIRKTMARYRVSHEWVERLATKVMQNEPPCMSDAEDWESANGWAQEIDAIAELNAQPSAQADPGGGAPGKLPVNPQNLRRAWESSQRVTREDWAEWARHFSVELLRESPSPALRACHMLAQVHPSMTRELFSAGFVSCWSELDAQMQEQLVRSLEAALASPTIPPEIVTALLNLAEFMEHDDKRLPLHTRTLGALAEKCHAFAKALHYKELDFEHNPSEAVEALIHINNQLRQPEAAVGVLTYANRHLSMELKESWYEKLCRWDDALLAYERRMAREAPGTPEYHTALLGKMRCLASLAEWEQLNGLCRVEWRKTEPHLRHEISMISAHAAWHMGQWEDMATYVDAVDVPDVQAMGTINTATGAFLRAVLSARGSNYESAKVHIERARDLMSTEFAALVGESYERAYTDMIRVQQLAELEEVVEYKSVMERRGGAEAAGVEPRLQFIKQLWRDRLKGVQRNVEVWQSLFSIRQLVVPMAEDVDSWLKFAALCRKSGRVKQAKRMLLKLLRYEPLGVGMGRPGYGAGSGAPNVMLAYLKHLWFEKGLRQEALARLRDLVTELPPVPAKANGQPAAGAAPLGSPGGIAAPLAAAAGVLSGPAGTAAMEGVTKKQRPSLPGRANLRLGMWTWSQSDGLENTVVIQDILQSLYTATEHAPGWAKAWHQWALFNVAVMQHYHTKSDPDAAILHVAPAVRGFFRSVALGQAAGDRTGNLQDILRLMTLWFNHGSYPDVERALQAGFNEVSIDTWLVVIPQIIARIHTTNPTVRGLIHQLLVKIGKHHPQALMYPLLVATKSLSPSRRTAAFAVLDHIRQHSATLVEQAQLVSHELIRMAILWHEMWHEGLEEASRLYFGESNVESMLNTLLPLHDMMDKNGPTTLKEIAFVQAYGRELTEAYDWLMKYKVSRKEGELHQAWDLYYHVFKRINKQVHSLSTLELQYVAPALVKAQGMELAVPGTYIAGEALVQITAFASLLHVINSKQRPRKLTIHGSNGAEYMFLLKGHEDLRQDERVMQLFGLVNTLLGCDRTTAERDLSIARYAVIPLSPNSGLIGWVPNCDTLHALIKEYREVRKIPLNLEHRLMLAMAPDYDHLTVIQKVEVFEHALEGSSGADLHKVLWLKSRNSEVWLDRRTNYTRSAAVMSMVGYILGLGDRHPSNLMLDRYSGKLLHIDFGDCFEASMNREKFPEKVPFRLTRMMIKAMEVSGIEGNFRNTCENVMRVLRMNKESVTAMLEAFVHDPLINWRLLHTAEATSEPATTRDHFGTGVHGTLDENVNAGGSPTRAATKDNATGEVPRRETREREMREARDQLGDAKEVLNSRAVEVMKRMSDKLMGRDYLVEGLNMPESDSVPAQVQRLITQAISHENLCQSYIGWCPFW